MFPEVSDFILGDFVFVHGVAGTSGVGAEVVAVGAGIIPASAVFDFDDAVDLVEAVAIVSDDNYCCRRGLHPVDEFGFGFVVHEVGWFVDDGEVGVRMHDLDDFAEALLAAGKAYEGAVGKVVHLEGEKFETDAVFDVVEAEAFVVF